MKIKKHFFFKTLSLLLLFYNECNSQNDTSSVRRGFLGWHLGTGIEQMNFSDLHKYGFLLDAPSNYSFRIFSNSIYLGNPDKFFISIPFGISSASRTGIFNNYNVTVNSGYEFFGVIGSYQIYRKNKNKIFKAIYPSIGVQYVPFSITSKANGKGISNTDTTFYYESSHVNNLLVNAEIMIELLNLRKSKNDFPSFPLTLKFGYNLQVTNPKWKYDSITKPIRNVGDENPKVNLGGFYVSIGINFWLQKRQSPKPSLKN